MLGHKNTERHFSSGGNTDDAFAALQKLKTKEEIIAELHKTVQEGVAVIGRIAGKNDGEVVESQFFGKTTRLSFAKTRFICSFSNLACLSPNQIFRDQNSILA